MNDITINELKMYSPNQVLIGSLFGGPLAMLFFLWENFKTLGKSNEAKFTVIYGIVFVIALITFPQFLPQQILGIIIQVVYSLCALQVVNSMQMSKDDIEDTANYSFQSNWRVLAYCIFLYIMWFAIIYPVTNFLAALGVIG